MRAVVFVGLLPWILAALSPAAQEVPGFPKPQAEHEWLKQFAGEWETTAEAPMGPGQPPMTRKGTMSSRMLGGFWMISESKTEVTGAPMAGVLTVGYDPQKKKYVGTWVDSMTNHLWRYEGAVDETGKKLTLEAEGPNMLQAGKTAKFRDAYEFQVRGPHHHHRLHAGRGWTVDHLHDRRGQTEEIARAPLRQNKRDILKGTFWGHSAFSSEKAECPLWPSTSSERWRTVLLLN